MKGYLINKFCRRVLHDKDFRELVLRYPSTAISSMPFTRSERDALLNGDVAALYHEGASAFLLLILCRFEVLGLTLPVFNGRMRAISQDQSKSFHEQ
ncbi:Aromatic-ring-opening dioxygenase LigAB, LigA subunit [Bradyrhizobium sp. WSM1253]|nr:Aromatic-ring-opening dioxygenase LigAB, LigA subunit [Bradyrhizobium sp. WSM1253]